MHTFLEPGMEGQFGLGILLFCPKCTLRLTNIEMENPLFVKESSLPRDHFPLPCLSRSVSCHCLLFFAPDQ